MGFGLAACKRRYKQLGLNHAHVESAHVSPQFARLFDFLVQVRRELRRQDIWGTWGSSFGLFACIHFPGPGSESEEPGIKPEYASGTPLKSLSPLKVQSFQTHGPIHGP